MSKRLVMFCIAVLAVALAIPAYAEVQNVKVSGDLNIVALHRYNFALGDTDVNSGGNQDALATITRLRVDAELTDNVSVVLRLLNERLWDAEETTTTTADDNGTEIDLDLAYAVLKEFLYSPLTLTAGRQELHFGNDLIVGDPDGNNAASTASVFGAGGTLTDIADLSARKAFDAIRGTLDYVVADQPLVVDTVYSVIDENTNNRDDDIRLYGANANYPVNDDVLTEVYVWTRERRPGSLASVTGANTADLNELKTERLHTIGARGVYTGVDNLILQAEFAAQTGNKIMDSGALLPNYVFAASTNNNPNGYRIEDSFAKVDAWALQLISSYALEGIRHDPTLGLSYTHLSGEDPYTCSSGTWNGWDAMYENQAGGTIWNKLIGFSNCDLINVNASAKPDFIDDLTVIANWYHIRLDRKLTDDVAGGYILTGIANAQGYKVTSDKHLGDEIDVDLIYDYTEDVQLGLSLGWFVPGDTLHAVNKDTATQAIASMKVTF